jgi:hypothetical protein
VGFSRACALLGPLVVLFAGSARASTDLPLEWSAPEGCTTDQRMVSAVQKRLGDSPVALTDLGVRGRIEREGEGWVATLVLHDDQGNEMGERRVHEPSADCRALEGPVSLVVAMMLRQHLTRADFFVPPPPAPPPVVPAKPVLAERPAPGPAAPAARPLRVSWTTALSCSGSVGVLPEPAIGASARIDNRFGEVFGVALEVAHQITSSIRPFADAPGTVSFSMLAASAVIHLTLLRSDRFEIGPTAAVGAGVVWAQGTGFDFNQTDASAMVTLGLGALASVRLVAKLRLEIVVEAAVPLVHDRYEAVHAAETASFENGPFAGHFEAGLSWRVP